MRLAALMLTGLSLLSACAELGAEGDRVARQAAKGVVNTVISNRFPGMNAAPLTDCIIDNADITEVYQIAEAAVVGPGPTTTNLIVDIASRPETVRCAADNALSTVLSGA
ncbi:succinate dehydrogenase [Yoonia sp.]|uniref:succinate dehydrogenase n=1 Tax=Yoonia sp. TaxID=2212373 RepID=UPI003F6AB26F